MAAAIEIVAIPVTFLVVTAASALWGNFSLGSIALAAFLFFWLAAAVSLLFGFAWKVEEDEGVHEDLEFPRHNHS